MGECAGGDGEEGERFPSPVQDDARNREEREKEQPVPEYSPGIEGACKKNVADRFIDEVGENCPESTEADETPVVQASGDREAQDEAEEEVAGDEHFS